MSATAQEDDYERALHQAKEREELLAELNELVSKGGHAEILIRLEPLAASGLDPRFGNLQGVCLAALGRHREAIAAFEAALRQDLQRPELHRNLAISLQEIGMTGRAFAEFEEAVRLDPEDPETRLALAESLIHFGRLRPAEEELGRAERALPGDIRVSYARVRLAEGLGDATMEYAAWVAVDSLAADAESASALGRLAATAAEQLEWYRRCAERDPAASECWARQGELQLAAGELSGATAALRKAVESGAGEAALHNLYLALQMASAADEIELLVDSRPPPRGASWGAVALSRRQAGRLEKALTAASRGRELDQEDLQLANLEAVLRMEMGQDERARQIWRWILERDPAHPEARGNLGLE
jgi:Flp pilus assembly protein TadD